MFRKMGVDYPYEYAVVFGMYAFLLKLGIEPRVGYQLPLEGAKINGHWNIDIQDAIFTYKELEKMGGEIKWKLV